MFSFIACLILSASPAAPIDPMGAEAVEVFTCDFGEAADKNFDGWPDGWSRRRSSGYPLFLPTAIVNEAPAGAPAMPVLKIQLDGGSAAIFSPHIPVNPLFSYRVDGLLRTEGLKHDIAYYTLMFFDADGRLLETHESAHEHALEAWSPITIGPVSASNPETYSAVIGLHLRPRDGTAQDLRGAAWFDEIKLSRLPRVTLKCAQKQHLYTSINDVEVICEVSGVLTANPLVSFVLEDVYGQKIAEYQTPLGAMPAHSNHAVMTSKKEEHARVVANHAKHDEAHDKHEKHDKHEAHDEPAQVRGYAGHATWKPPLTNYGFYRVRVSLADSEAARIERTTTLVVARPLKPADRGEYGWSLPQGDKQLSLAELLGVINHAGIHWLKFPMWYAEDDATRPDRLAWFADRAGGAGVSVIGVLDKPPPSLLKTFGDAQHLPVATIFVEAPLWQPAVDPVMTRLSLKVRWWQLGGDNDASFVGFPELPQKIAEIKQHFLKFGQEVQVGMTWPWLSEAPAGPWSFLSHVSSPGLTAAETASYLSGKQKPPHARWMMLEPLSSKQYDLDTRTRDMVERMLAAKVEHADAIFLPDPFDAQHGVLHQDGTPRELLLPWRTTATLLGGSEYLGSIQMPSGSTNHLFRRGHEAVMLVWNQRATTESLYLGEQIEHFDLWGRTLAHQTADRNGAREQTIEVGPLPTFVTGLSLPVAKWRLGIAFESQNLASVFGRDQKARYRFKNTFTQGVGGEVRITASDDWEINPFQNTFRCAEGEEVRDQFDVRLKSDAQSGPQMLRLDFKITADRDYAFSAYQPLNVGIGDVEIETLTRLADNGDLLIEQTFINQTDRFVSFNCLLFAPGRRRERVQVVNLGRGRHSATFTLSNGRELIGEKLLLRAEEIDGDRVLNYRIVPEL
jgi:hypothetical protein